MNDQNACHRIIEQKLSELSFPAQPVELYEPVKYILDIGGKRIRPVLTLMAHNLFSDDLAKALDVAIAIEVFHNFTLLHDDIMDKADKRRGKETVHVKWDENRAILSGDAMMILAYNYLSKYRGEKQEDVFTVFNRTALEVCEGQQMDINFEKMKSVSIDDYLRMIQLKTSVLIAASLQIGAITGGADSKNQQLLYDFGLNIGLGFQLQDDYLDVYASSTKFGKETGGDIVQNKKTYLLISALNHQRKDLVSRLEKLLLLTNDNREKKVREIIGIYNEMGIPQLARGKADEYFQVGLQKLNQVEVADKKKAHLITMVEALINRQH